MTPVLIQRQIDTSDKAANVYSALFFNVVIFFLLVEIVRLPHLLCLTLTIIFIGFQDPNIFPSVTTQNRLTQWGDVAALVPDYYCTSWLLIPELLFFISVVTVVILKPVSSNRRIKVISKVDDTRYRRTRVCYRVRCKSRCHATSHDIFTEESVKRCFLQT